MHFADTFDYLNKKKEKKPLQGKTFPMCKYDSNKDGNFKLL
jgi:hypothetical protein